MIVQSPREIKLCTTGSGFCECQMTNVRRRLITEIAITSGLEVSGIDINVLLRNLILFDTVVLKSQRLKEFPFLIRALGYSGLMELLSSKALDIYCEGATIIESVEREGHRELPIGEYSFGWLEAADHRKYVSSGMEPLTFVEGISWRETQRVKRAIASRLVRPPSDFGQKVLDQFNRDLRSGSPAIKRAVALRLAKKLGTPSPEFSIRLFETKDRQFRAETNLFDMAQLSRESTNKLIEVALGGIGSLNQRLGEMRSVSALSGFSEDEIALFEDKLAFLAMACNPSVSEAQFRRILVLTGFPEFRVENGTKIDVGKLLEIRQTRECAEFREWLTTIDSASDAEIKDRIGSVRSKLSSLVHGSTGKGIRLLASAGIGLIPVAGPLAGLVEGYADTFLVDKVLPESGAVSFISNLYPSVFKASR